MSPGRSGPPASSSKSQGLLSSLQATSLAMGSSSDPLSNMLGGITTRGPFLRRLFSILMPWMLLLTAVTENQWLGGWYSFFKYSIINFLTTSVTIHSHNQMHPTLLRWMMDVGLRQDVRTLIITHCRWSPPDADEDWAPLRYVPDAGEYTVTFEGRKIVIFRSFELHERSQNRRPGLDEIQYIKVSCMNRWAGLGTIKRFLEHVRDTTVEDRPDTTRIYCPQKEGWQWDHGSSRTSRNLDAVTLDNGIKEALVQDVERYLDRSTKAYYRNRGIPYRRGYLLYGPPGTGKTSFTTALAGHFELDVYLITLASPSLDNERLESLFGEIPTKCIVLLEDIDSTGIKREDMTAMAKANLSNGAKNKGEEDDSPARVTLSGLLNVLDGIRSVEGRIVIMTSNRPDSLDEALIRQGRIDQKILFGYASASVAAQLFRHIFIKTPEEMSDGEKQQDAGYIDQLSQVFAENLPANRLTPAEVQGFLLDHRNDPEDAVEHVAAYAENILMSGNRYIDFAKDLANPPLDVSKEVAAASKRVSWWPRWR